MFGANRERGSDLLSQSKKKKKEKLLECKHPNKLVKRVTNSEDNQFLRQMPTHKHGNGQQGRACALPTHKTKAQPSQKSLAVSYGSG